MAVFVSLLTAACAAGCGTKRDAERNRPAAKPAKIEKKDEEPPIAGEVRNLDLTLTDKNGIVVARVKARAGLVGRTGAGTAPGGAAGATSRTEATLHEAGKPTAILTADRIEAEQATRTVTATGSVVARSLVHEGSPTVRADRMVWRPGENKVRGAGNVLLTREGLRMPGRSFVADTKLREIEVDGNGSPITGHLPASRR